MTAVSLVNDRDEFVGSKDVRDVRADEIYRVSALWLTDEDGQVLLARRAWSKRVSPGMWGPAVTGTVEPGETYLSNMVKEITEELGLTNLTCEPVFKEFVRRDTSYFMQWYSARVERASLELHVSTSEVAEIRWFSQKELTEALVTEPSVFISAVKRFTCREETART
jgi:isopentenyl-diphosphate delta-isomerase